MVDQDYQNRGIGALLTKKWTAEVDVPVTLGISDDAYRMFIRAGWVDVGRIVHSVKLLDVVHIIRRHIRISAIARVVSAIVNSCLKLRDDARFSRGNKRVSIKKVDRFDQTIDELWDRASVHYDVIAKRDSVYLNWRYADEPSLSYSLLRFDSDDQAVGYAALITGEEDGISTGYIIDFFAEPRHVKCVMGQITRYFRGKEVRKVYLYVLCKRLEVVLRKIGFHRRGERARLMVEQKNGIPSLVGDSDKWFATLGDCDLTEEFLGDTEDGRRG